MSCAKCPRCGRGPEPSPLERRLTVREACEVAGFKSSKTLWRAIKADPADPRHLTAAKLGRQWRIRESDLAAWLERRDAKAEAAPALTKRAADIAHVVASMRQRVRGGA